MKRIAAFVTSFGLMAVLTIPAIAADQFLTVTFKPGTQAKFVQTLSTTFKAPIDKQLDQNTYRFKVPKLRQLHEYSELFASFAYVTKTNPAPRYEVADNIQPRAVNIQGVNTGPGTKSQDYLPGQVLVKFKPGTSADDIRFLNSHHKIVQAGFIKGVDVYQMQLPQGLSVEEAISLYNDSGIVEYAEPNYRMQLPVQPGTQPAGQAPVGNAQNQQTPQNTQGQNGATVVVTEIPLDGGNQIQVDFRPNFKPDQLNLFNQIYGTQLVEKLSFSSYRLQLPMNLNPQRAERIIRLYPYVINAQRLYS